MNEFRELLKKMVSEPEYIDADWSGPNRKWKTPLRPLKVNEFFLELAIIAGKSIAVSAAGTMICSSLLNRLCSLGADMIPTICPHNFPIFQEMT